MSSLLVAAIDFGTTYSGWAFSFNHEYERDPLKIFAKQWTGGQLVSQKGPTSVLIHPDGKTLHSFGYEAESKYGELALDKRHKQWFFFKRFKMSLFGRIGIERNIKIEDASGKQLKAKTVFALSIKYLKNDLIKMSEKRIADGGIVSSDIHWVLTVPAIWNDAAKQFMREAAQEAGIANGELTIALEPEAASLFCRHLPVEKSLGRDKVSLAKFKAGQKYLVLDAGELHKASGGAWGGTKVDAAFEAFLSEIIGSEGIKKFKEDHREDYIDMFRDFEIKKRDIAQSKNSKITMRIPITLVEMAKKTGGKSMKRCIAKSKYKEPLILTGDKIRIEANIMRRFFDVPLQSILSHLETLLDEPPVSSCSAIVMVGGFSESPMLQDQIQTYFKDMKIIIPEEAGLAVLKGAVIFGHKPTTIAERVCKFTYGESTTHLTSDFCNHSRSHSRLDNNLQMRCFDIFSVHVRINQSVKLGEEQEEQICTPIYDSQTTIGFEIYASSNPNPEFVTDPGCSRIGRFSVPIPDTSLGKLRKFGISFLFGGTEIEIKVVDKATGEITKQSVDFLG